MVLCLSLVFFLESWLVLFMSWLLLAAGSLRFGSLVSLVCFQVVVSFLRVGLFSVGGSLK